ncbi:MAG TPA: outer membrane beta-barrel protein [Opitutaceae bacterium]
MIAPISSTPQAPSALQGISEVGPIPDLMEAAIDAIQVPTPVEAGPFKFLPHLLYRFLYGNGIQPQPGFQATTGVSTFAPGILVDMGTHWTLDYTPTWNWYSNHVFTDSVDQEAALNGGAQLSDWVLQAGQSFTTSHNPLVETGMQTEEKDYLTTFDAQHQVAPGLLLDLGLDQDVRLAAGFPTSRAWDNADWLRYRVAPKVVVSAGAGAGYVTVSEGPDQYYFTPEAQVSVEATDKTSFDATVGYQSRTFIEEPRLRHDSPVFQADIVNRPTETTKITLSGSKQVAVSYFVDETTQTTQWDFKVDQRFLQHLFLTADLGEEYVDYLSTLTQSDTVRDDHDLLLNVRLGTTFLGRGSFALLYARSHNDSSLAGYSFTSNQVGFEVSYKY